MSQQWQQKDVLASEVVVAIPADLRRRLDLYISQCKLEISGLGTVENRSGILEVTGIYLLEQEVSSGQTELSAAGVAAFLAEAPSRGIDPAKVRLWWHSHATMSTFWSSTDEQAIDTFDASAWWLSIVGNHAGEYKARLDIFPNQAVPLRLTHPAQLMMTYVKEELDSVRDEIGRLVREAPKKSVAPATTGKRPTRTKKT